VKLLLDHDVPAGLSHLLEELGHTVTILRKVLPNETADESVLQFAYDNDCVLLTCNRDDFLQLAKQKPHHGIIIVIRRRTRAEERAKLFALLDRAGETGIKDNINFA
jgi:predicted nuclease of predicted toxin-antitoxin system